VHAYQDDKPLRTDLPIVPPILSSVPALPVAAAAAPGVVGAIPRAAVAGPDAALVAPPSAPIAADGPAAKPAAIREAAALAAELPRHGSPAEDMLEAAGWQVVEEPRPVRPLVLVGLGPAPAADAGDAEASSVS
jgi:hypothetical protein